jgi:hypothetical protein
VCVFVNQSQELHATHVSAANQQFESTMTNDSPESECARVGSGMMLVSWCELSSWASWPLRVRQYSGLATVTSSTTATHSPVSRQD